MNLEADTLPAQMLKLNINEGTHHVNINLTSTNDDPASMDDITLSKIETIPFEMNDLIKSTSKYHLVLNEQSPFSTAIVHSKRMRADLLECAWPYLIKILINAANKETVTLNIYSKYKEHVLKLIHEFASNELITKLIHIPENVLKNEALMVELKKYVKHLNQKRQPFQFVFERDDLIVARGKKETLEKLLKNFSLLYHKRIDRLEWRKEKKQFIKENNLTKGIKIKAPKPSKIQATASNECKFSINPSHTIDPIKFKNLTKCLQTCHQIQLDFKSDLGLKKCELKSWDNIEFVIFTIANTIVDEIQLIQLLGLYEFSKLKCSRVKFKNECYNCFKLERGFMRQLTAFRQKSPTASVVHLEVVYGDEYSFVEIYGYRSVVQQLERIVRHILVEFLKKRFRVYNNKS